MTLEELYTVFLRTGKVFTDSRQVLPGGMFFALKGERFDGNRYASKALDQGAAFAIVDDLTVVTDDRFMLVEDVLNTLQQLARHHRRQFLIPVIGITGSNGKTTTKELAALVMESHYKLHFTKGNLNNHIGVPLTLLNIPQDAEVVIVEMGANHQGEIDALCRIAEPTHGLITNIGKAHLEGFGGLEGVKKGKSELYRYLAETNGIAFVDIDDPVLVALAEPVKKKIFYIQRDQPDPKHPYFEIKLLGIDPFVRVAFLAENGALLPVQSRLIGAYNFNNIKTAVMLGKYFKVPSTKIKAAIESYIPENNRSQMLTFQKNNYLLDAYNANPSSMEQALLNFGKMDAGCKIAILGDMLELGEYAAEEHKKMARLALSQGLERLILVGPQFAPVARLLGVDHFGDVQGLKAWFALQGLEGALILVKGSRGMRLEQLLS